MFIFYPVLLVIVLWLYWANSILSPKYIHTTPRLYPVVENVFIGFCFFLLGMKGFFFLHTESICSCFRDIFFCVIFCKASMYKQYVLIISILHFHALPPFEYFCIALSCTTPVGHHIHMKDIFWPVWCLGAAIYQDCGVFFYSRHYPCMAKNLYNPNCEQKTSTKI